MEERPKFTAPNTDDDNIRESRRSFACNDIDENHPVLSRFEPDIRSMVVKRTRLADRDGDGRISRDEFVLVTAEVATDAQKKARKETTLKRTVGGLTLLTVLGLLGNVGLIYAVLVITRHLDTHNESLVDSKTHKTLRTRSEGNREFVELNPEYQKRHLAISLEHIGDKDNFDHHIRKLNEVTPVAIFAKSTDAEAACKYFLGFEIGSNSLYCLKCAGMNTHETGGLVPNSPLVITHLLTHGESCERLSTEEELCDTYDQIAIQGTHRRYKVQCCGTGGCTIHASNTASGSAERRMERILLEESTGHKACSGSFGGFYKCPL